MSKSTTPEEKLQSSLNKVDRVFYQMQRNRISVRKGKGMSDNTVSTYKNLMKSLVKQVYKETGKADISKINENDIVRVLEKRAQNYKNGASKEGYNIKSIRSAVKAFSKGAKETSVFRKEMRFDGKKVDKMIQNDNIVRKSRHSSVLQATKEQTKKVINTIETTGYQTETRKIAANVLKCAFYSGARNSAALNLRPEDVFDNGDNTLTVWFFNDKGGLDHTVTIYDEEGIDFFKNLRDSGVPGQQILKAKRKDGTFKSTKNLQKDVSKVIKAAGKEFDTVKTVRERVDGKRVTKKIPVSYSTHSGRKTFVNERVKFNWERLKTESFESIMAKERPAEYAKIMTKYKAELEKVNANSYGSKKQERLSHSQEALLATAIDAAHYRLNILTTYYLDMKAFKNIRRKTRKTSLEAFYDKF